MKKVMIGILVLIPIIIMLLVAMVSAIVSTQAWISVEDILLKYKGTDIDTDEISYSLDESSTDVFNLNDMIDVVVLPEKANKYVIEWQIYGEVDYTDSAYREKYENYRKEYSDALSEIQEEYPDFQDAEKQAAYSNAILKYGTSDSAKVQRAMANELVDKVWQAATLVNSDGEETSSNSTGLIKISSFCSFSVTVTAENVSKVLSVSVVGEDVKTVTLSNVSGDEQTTMCVGESKRIAPNYTPIESIVNHTVWHALDEDIATIDQNGVITAKKAGVARFMMEASVHSSETTGNLRYVASNVYTIEVVARGASSKYGSKLSAHKRDYTLAELGILSDFTSVEGATVVDGKLSVNDGATQVVVHFGNDKDDFVINICDENAIAIQNADSIDMESGYILSVGGNTLKLNAVWASQLKQGAPSGVIWTSSDESVATVSENGHVKGINDGIVTVVASCDGVETSITLHVRTKVASLRLRTSDASLAVGLARETVFASERYNDIYRGNSKSPNYVDIAIMGEPKNVSQDALNEFYKSYSFEVVEGGEYASFGADVPNRLVFNPETLKELEYKDRRQTLTVKVSAKYSKHEGESTFTQKTVRINVVHGVAVYNMDELRQAALDQKAYTGVSAVYDRVAGDKTWQNINDALATDCPDNLVAPEKTFSHINAEDGKKYEVWTNPTSNRTYSISLMANCAFDTEKNEDGTPVNTIGGERPDFYGDVYGNNKMISAITGQIRDELIRVSWGNVTISNVVLRANSNPENGEISSADDTMAFTGKLVKVGSDVHWDFFRLENVRFDYCILENGTEGMDVRNTDLTINGCIVRNLLSCGFNVMNRMYTDVNNTIHPFYTHVKFNNFISSNTLASVLVATYEKYSYSDNEVGRFVKKDLDANEKYFLENFAKPDSDDERLRLNFEITQTGVFEVYNWQNIDYASIFKTGNDAIDAMIVSQTSLVIRNNPTFAPFRYIDEKGECYVHVAFVFAAVTVDGIKPIIEPTYQNLKLEDKVLNKLCSSDVESTPNGEAGEALLQKIGVTIYGYHNDAPILPNTTYQINTALIDRLHG